MNLLIDLGNSRLKWAWSAPGEWRSDAVDLAPDDLPVLCERVWASASMPARVVISSVLDEARTQQCLAWIDQRWSVAVHRVRAPGSQLGVTNGYHDPGSLGSDRWAALIGARRAVEGPLSVVDCGSAVTIDALSGRGEYLGGVIFPGLRLLRQALHAGTAGVRPGGGRADSCLARATSDGVAAGVLYGLCGAIERVIAEQRRTLGPEARVVITGGDAPAVAPRLGVDPVLIPELVLRGLEQIAGTLD